MNLSDIIIPPLRFMKDLIIIICSELYIIWNIEVDIVSN